MTTRRTPGSGFTANLGPTPKHLLEDTPDDTLEDTLEDTHEVLYVKQVVQLINNVAMKGIGDGPEGDLRFIAGMSAVLLMFLKKPLSAQDSVSLPADVLPPMELRAQVRQVLDAYAAHFSTGTGPDDFAGPSNLDAEIRKLRHLLLNTDL